MVRAKRTKSNTTEICQRTRIGCRIYVNTVGCRIVDDLNGGILCREHAKGDKARFARGSFRNTQEFSLGGLGQCLAALGQVVHQAFDGLAVYRGHTVGNLALEGINRTL